MARLFLSLGLLVLAPMFDIGGRIGDAAPPAARLNRGPMGVAAGT